MSSNIYHSRRDRQVTTHSGQRTEHWEIWSESPPLLAQLFYQPICILFQCVLVGKWKDKVDVAIKKSPGETLNENFVLEAIIMK